MELGFFLHFCFPLRTEAELLEETFALVYSTEGAFSYFDLWGGPMRRKDRDWFVARVAKQKSEERKHHEAELRNAGKGGRKKR